MPRPIVIIHGWSDTSASFGALRKFVASLPGAAPVQINLADYVSMDDEVRFDDLVVGMQRAWREVGLPTAPGSVDAVVHSTGGLVIRDWLATTYAPGMAPIKRLLMLAPANFGSPLAHKGRAFYGRIVKGFNSVKPFETGTRILKGLELASPYAWQLAMRDRFAKNHFSAGGVLCTVLVGNVGYDGIMAAANEDGSDGTVRASTANLNCALLEVDFVTDPLNPAFKLRPAAGEVAFRIMDNDNHSTVAMKDGGPRDPGGRAAIARALTVDDAGFADWCRQCAADTATITSRAETADQEEKFGYQNIVTRVTDDAGSAVADYFLEFYLEDVDEKKGWDFSKLFHRDVIQTVHAHADDKSCRSMLIDCTTLFRGIDKDQEYMKVSLTASPEFKVNGYVGYRTFSDKDIGGLKLTRQQMLKVFQPHRTLLVDIRIRRERAPEVFRIKKA